jgi:hypothetical protein
MKTVLSNGLSASKGEVNVTSYRMDGEKALAGAALLHKHRNTLAGMENLATNPTSN